MRGRATWRSDPHLDAGPAADGSPGRRTAGPWRTRREGPAIAACPRRRLRL